MYKVFATLMKPGVRGMRRMRLPLKLTAIGAVLLTPQVLLSLGIVRSAQGNLALTRAEQQGAVVVGALTEVVSAVQTHRELTTHSQAGEDAMLAERDQARQKLRAAVDQVEQSLKAASSEWVAQLDAEWAAARTSAIALAEGRQAGGRDQAFAEHVAEVERLRQFALRVGETSGLLLDPDADTFFLMDLTVQRLIPWMESLSAAGGAGADLLTSGEAGTAEKSALIVNAGQMPRLLADLAFPMQAAERAGVKPLPSWAQALEATSRYSQLIRDSVARDNLATLPRDFLSLGQMARKSVESLDHELTAELNLRLKARAEKISQGLWRDLGATSVGLLLMIYLGFAFAISFLTALRKLHVGMLATAEGDLANRMHIPGRDELADIGEVVEAMCVKLSAMVADIRSSAVRVGASGQEVAISGDALAQRTQAQADSLRQTSSTVAQLSEAVARNAGAAKTLDALAVGLRSQAEAGGQAMRETVHAMGALEQSSRRVGEIISVIDGIAFQTNILALNAAVEAARAGDSGRGFAVVAAEVRQLALRSSSASAEIKQLIEQSHGHVGNSVQRIHQVGATLDTVVDGVRDVSDRLRDIAQASGQQSIDLEGVSKGLDSLDDLTKQNAEMVTQSSASAVALVTRAAALSEAVESMRLRQGSADEAQTMVHRALALIEQNGMAAAMPLLRQANSGFVDRDLYIFTVDRQGCYRMHSANPAMEGKRVHEVPGIDGDRFVRDAWAATQDSHWVEYDILNAETGLVQPKASYVVALSDELLIGCGIYRRSDRAASVSVPAGAAKLGVSGLARPLATAG